MKVTVAVLLSQILTFLGLLSLAHSRREYPVALLFLCFWGWVLSSAACVAQGFWSFRRFRHGPRLAAVLALVCIVSGTVSLIFFLAAWYIGTHGVWM